MDTFTHADARTRAIKAGVTTRLCSTLLDGRKHYGVMRFEVASGAETLVVNLTGTNCDDLATAESIAARMSGGGLSTLLGFSYYGARIK